MSRLDRLLALLENGTTPATRKAAANQIGEIQKLHPHELFTLLNKVYPFLRSKSWDTRIAAGQAIEAIASNLPAWKGRSADETKPKKEGDSGFLIFSTFDINRVLERGAPLLASGGTEFDENLDDLNSVEKMAAQRQRLKKKLGLEHTELELFSEEDLKVSTNTTSKKFLSPPSGPLRSSASSPSVSRQNIKSAASSATAAAAAAAPASEVLAGMSARERNRAKRKMRQGVTDLKKSKETVDFSKMGDSDEEDLASKRKTKNVVMETTTPAPAATESKPAVSSSKLMLEAVADPASYFDEVWPFQSFCDQLAQDLFDPAWEIRHGAAVGLREILKRHGADAGRASTRTAAESAAWLEDLCIRVLCVLALDRFADFVSDQVVAPVRETCSQVLGALLQHVRAQVVRSVVGVLLVLLARQQWELRHAGLLALKYVVAVRQDQIDHFISDIMPALLTALRDADDDVRAVAAETLLPIAQVVLKLASSHIPALLAVLWDLLKDRDDLTASTSSVMNLLSTFYSLPGLENSQLQSRTLAILAPRLFPFFRHTIASVRLASLRTFDRLLGSAAASSLLPILPNTLQYLFKNFLAEEKEAIRETNGEVWLHSLSKFQPKDLRQHLGSGSFARWLNELFSSPERRTLQASSTAESPVVAAASAANDADGGKKRRGRPPVKSSTDDAGAKKLRTSDALGGGGLSSSSSSSVAPEETEEEMLKRRIIAAESLSAVIARWPVAELGEVANELAKHLLAQSAYRRLLVSLLLARAASSWTSGELPEPIRLLAERLNAQLEESEDQSIFAEVQRAEEHLDTEARTLYSSLVSVGALAAPDIPPWKAPPAGVRVSLQLAADLAGETFSAAVSHLPAGDSLTDQLNARQKRLVTAIGYVATCRSQLYVSVQAAAAGAVVSLRIIPQKLNPVIRSLMASIRTEESVLLLQRAAASLASLMDQCLAREVSPNAKVLGNLAGFLLAGPVVEDDAAPPLAAEDEERKAAAQMRKGAACAVRALAQHFGTRLFEALPPLWAAIANPIAAKAETAAIRDPSAAKPLLEALALVRELSGALHSDLHAGVLALGPAICQLIQHTYSPVQVAAGACIAALCRSITAASMELLIRIVLPLVSDPERPHARLGAVSAVRQVVEGLGLSLVPYLVFFLVPLLGRMSDQHPAVRQRVTHCFATLVRLMPLEPGAGDPPLPTDLLQRKATERRFLEQLLDGSKIEPYTIPIVINAELRKYQRDGINWLAFLNRYQLHGILCDDMGLGKTLQTIVMIVSDNHSRKEQFKATQRADYAPLPSLVVCPPTLVSHWHYEVNKFCKGVSAMMYGGSPSERTAMLRQMHSQDIVIMSYDIVRNDIDSISSKSFNYCVLDEGHIIKNPRTKITQAVKRVQANHRLILSGTPIQNHVLELWSLFDFLMPGFLGTEKDFNEQYARPILAVKDNKAATAAEQEASTLALEALHRQVLPFVLRRLKENVLADLPPKIIQDYYCNLSPLQVKLYEAFSKSQKGVTADDMEKLENELEKGGASKSQQHSKSEHVFQALQYLRKLCSHPCLVLGSDHPMYANVTDELQRSGTKLHALQHSPKLLALRELLLECGIGGGREDPADDATAATNATSASCSQHRVLIFAQMKSTLDLVEQDVFKASMPSVSYLRLDGSIEASKRQAVVHQFNDDPTIDALLLTTHVGGLGLNLTGADTVIFLEHDWNPQKDLQAMDRAHRLGQKKVVNVYRLITRGTLEEKIMGLQQFKLNIANSVVNMENSSMKTMEVNQLLELFDFKIEKEKAARKADDGGSAIDAMGQPKRKGGSGMKAVLENLTELWDESQYNEEYSLGSFLKGLK